MLLLLTEAKSSKNSYLSCGTITSMKNLVVIFALALFACSKSANKESEFYVRGNCEMCKERIESAAKAVPGVSKANWDVNSSSLKVVFDSTKASEMDIHKAIASTGHGTEQAPMDTNAHAALPECCQVENSH